jgi:large subunit ribosomal protein L24
MILKSSKSSLTKSIMKLKKGDSVIITSGKDKGKTGKIAKAFPKEEKVLIEGVNMKKKHERARKGGQKGQVVERPMPIHISNVMISDPATGKPSRIGKKFIGGKMVRISKKSGKEI